MTATEIRSDPEFQKLQAEAGKLQKQADSIMDELYRVLNEVEKRWPAGEGMAWTMSAIRKLMRVAIPED